MQEEIKPQSEKRTLTGVQRAARIVLKVILFLFLFIILIFLLILTPPVQRFATGEVEQFLEEKLKTKVDIGRISLGLPRNVHLKDVFIADRTGDTLISGGLIKVDIALLDLLSNKVSIKDIELKDITAKVKRVLPDTTFNFQFIIDAFTPQKQMADTTQTAAMELDVDNVRLDNIRVFYTDIITGNDMYAAIKGMTARIDSLNPTLSHYAVPDITVRGMKVRFKQQTPLVEPEPISEDLNEAVTPAALKLNFGNISLYNVDVDYGNDVSAFYTLFNIGQLVVDARNFNLQDRVIHLNQLQIDNTISAIRLGRKIEAQLIEKEVKKEIEVQKQQDWQIRIDEVALNRNTIQFDNDNSPRQPYGMDYAHFRGDSITLHIRNFVMNTDSIFAIINKGYFKEKSGFQLDALQGEILYANNQAYLKNLYLKTPGTELKRNAVLEYASYDALVKNFPQTVMDVEIVDSRIQVKDILTFAPDLRTHPAFKNPSEIWHLNIVGSGTLNRLNFESLQFSGLKDTRIDASGTLAGLMNPTSAGGNFTIRTLRTSQTDISVFTGSRLSTPDINLPETFEARGTLSGTMNALRTDLFVSTSAGAVAVRGNFTNLTDPASATYAAQVNTRGLRLGSILRNAQIGTLSTNMRLSGSGFTPETMRTRFDGVIYAVGFNDYTYRNVQLNGTLNQNVFNIDADVNDPNIDLNVTAKGNLNSSSFSVNGFVDSIKTQPLGFTADPMVFRGKIDANIASLNADYLDANVYISQGLIVKGKERVVFDSLQLVAGKSGTDQFIRLNSPFANAAIEGQYRFAELGDIFINNIDPYFSIVPGQQLKGVRPYDFTFTIDIINSPFISDFVPGLTLRDPLHAEGKLATGQGLQASLNTASLVYQQNNISGIDVKVNTTAEGLQVTGNIGHFQSGTSDIYNTQLTATALNDVIDFGLNVDDKANKDKYVLSGVLSQPTQGTYALQLRPENLLLNYESWTIAPNNQLIISPNNIIANNFSLQRGNQTLTLQSASGLNGGPLDVSFSNFRLGTVTGFFKADSALVDGVLNGNATFRDIMHQPLFTSNLTIADLSFRGDTVGNVSMVVSSKTPNRYLADINLTGYGNDVRINGTMSPQGNDVAMNLELAVRQLQLNTFEGAMAEFVTSATGAVRGNVSINGTTSEPRIRGTLNFDSASVHTIAIGGPLTINNESLTVTENGFNFNQFTIRDSANSPLHLNGTVATTNFINYRFNIDVDAQNFRVLNTTKKVNSLYYGEMYVTTNLNVSGTERNPVVDGNVIVNEGTNFSLVIPQAEPGVTQREGVVEFVDFSNPGADSLFLAYDSLNIADITGFNVAANISISKEANFNVIVDVANGDFLNLRGTGELTTGIDPSGAITLTGTYEIEEGAYQFSYNFLRRRFDIEKGSKITWFGEPTNAELDVTAVYIANTAPLDLVEGRVENTERNYYLQRLPFHVYLQLNGELLKPLLTFDIRLPEERSYAVSGDIVSNVRARLAELRQEPSELNKQVFAILLLNRFIGDNPFQSSGGGLDAGTFARQSVSKLMTEQLNDLAAGLIDGVDINFDVASSDDYTTGDRRSRTDLNVGLSKRLLNDRLTVTVGSNFQLEGPTQSNQSSNNIAGNVAVQYQLSKDGRYMLRFYRRNEYEGMVDGYVIETGLGFIISVDYNRFREIIHGRRIKREARRANNKNAEQ